MAPGQGAFGEGGGEVLQVRTLSMGTPWELASYASSGVPSQTY